MSSILQKLTEGVTHRSVRKEGAALLKKWERTGLLEGLKSERERENMSRLLENQAKELLREASTMQSGEVEGFAAVAFPIVRRIFGNLIAQDLVSVQPMSLPNGLIFFMDFTHTHEKLNAGAAAATSVYGGGVTARDITTGVDLSGKNAERGFYNFANGYSSPTGSQSLTDQRTTDPDNLGDNEYVFLWTGSTVGTALTDSDKAAVRFDVDVTQDDVGKYIPIVLQLSEATWNKVNLDNLVACDLESGTEANGVFSVRRLTDIYNRTNRQIYTIARVTGTGSIDTGSFVYPYKDQFTTADALGAMKGTSQWPFESTFSDTDQTLPEIDIKVNSIDIRAVTKKLKAKWTPELGQDIDAYHNTDIEVELTGVLSEYVALEVNNEILEDLVVGATAGTLYWSRIPGQFVNRETGAVTGVGDFTGNVSMWYETLVETINDVSARIHRKTLRGGANFLVTSPEIANVLEMTAGFRANITHDDEKGTVSVMSTGSLNKKWDVWVSPYFPRNLILIGRKGSSFLESGYVYAPYVPLQVTPTIFGVEDFTPRKMVMTRYGKKMVRSDMYGLCVVRDLV